MEYTYKEEKALQHFSINTIKLIIFFFKLYLKSKFFSQKLGLAGIKAFFKVPMTVYTLHSELHVYYTFPPTLTAVLRSCVRE